MDADRLRPASLTVNRQAETLEILWADGHLSVLPLAGLRNVCPCAECRGGHQNMGGPVNRAALHQRPPQTWDLQNAFLVGHYAMGILWADGHDGGIYTWSFLRALCPCAQCEAEAEGSSAQDIYPA
jgi:DUF971 family protein